MREKNIPIIDLHTHLFNARYLPLKGIFKRWIKLGLPAAVLATIVNAITRDAQFSNKKEREQWITLVQDRTEEQLIRGLFDLVMAELYRRAVLQIKMGSVTIQEFLDEDDLYDALEYISSEFGESWNELSVTQAAQALTTVDGRIEQSELEAFLGEWFWSGFSKFMAEMNDRAKAPVLDGSQLIQFIGLMIMDELSIAQELIDGYESGNHAADQVGLFVHHMMDMEKAYKKGWIPPRKPYYRYKKDQLPRMEKLVQKHGGRILGFTAFDPRRPNWRKYVDKGLTHGNCGVKFYPPMGYRAWGNDDSIIDCRVKDFLKYCADEQIPVFTHCTPIGFEAGYNFGENSHPEYWYKALKQFDGLRLCFGHAGGGIEKERGATGWFAANEEEWQDVNNYARCVIELCQNYENVYCEIAYLDELMNESELKECFKKRLKENIYVNGAKYQLADKIQYGSDWHMPGMVGRTAEYLEALQEIFTDEELIGHSQKFFSLNALHYLNLDRCIDRHQKKNSGFLKPAMVEYLRTLANHSI